MSENIMAKLKKIIWRSIENDYTIAVFQPENGDPELIATGDLYSPIEGLVYDMEGKWTEHAKYGRQFSFYSYCIKQTCDSDSIAIFLRRYIKGVGPVLADVLVEKYGKSTITILKGAPHRVSDEIKGVSYDMALKISEQLKEDDKRQDMLVKLEGLFSKVKGLPKKLASEMIKLYGLKAYEVVKNNPYILIEMNRVGFLSADKVAMACGIDPDSLERICRCVVYVIKQMMQESGDVWLSPPKVAENVSILLNGTKFSVIENAFKNLLEDGVLVKYGGLFTLAKFNDDESLIADCVGRFLT